MLRPAGLSVFIFSLMAVALAKLFLTSNSLYPTFILLIAIGFIVLFNLFKALIYSIAKILFGLDKILEYFIISFKYISKAFSLAFGKDRPLESSWFNKLTNLGGSLYKTSAHFSKTSILQASLPKEI